MDKNTNPVPLVFKEKVPMEHYNRGAIWGALGGVLSGLGKYIFFLQANASFPEKLFQAILTAILCGLAGGIAGAAGKWLWEKFKKRFIVKHK